MRARIVMTVVILFVAFSAGMFIALNERRTAEAPDIAGLLWPEPPVIGPFSLLDSEGRAFTQDNLSGHWTLIFFGFTNCPDICPTTMNTLNRVYEQLNADEEFLEKLQVLFVSVDPERDEGETLRKYIDYFNPAFIGATANDAELHRLTRQFGVLFMKVELPGQSDYSMDHSASILLVDPQLRFVGVFSQPHDAAEIAGRLPRMVSFIEAAR